MRTVCPALVALTVLFSCFPACSTSQERQGHRGTEGAGPAPQPAEPGDPPPSPEPPRHLDKAWVVLADRADKALLQVKLGEMMARSADKDEKRRHLGYVRMAGGMRALMAVLRDVRRLFATARQGEPNLEMRDWEQRVTGWAHDLMQARKLLPEKYAKLLLDEEGR